MNRSSCTLATCMFFVILLAIAAFEPVVDAQNGGQSVYLPMLHSSLRPGGNRSGATELISISTTGIQGDRQSYAAGLSGDGRYITFSSASTSLVENDTNDGNDVFVHDRQTAQTNRISLAYDGSNSNGSSTSRDITSDGRFIVFNSSASNLISSNGISGHILFLYDTHNRSTIGVPSQEQFPDRPGNGDDPAISDDGNVIAFYSPSSTYVPNDTNDTYDVFVYDRRSDQVTLVSLGYDGSPAGGESVGLDLSADGRFIAYTSNAPNIVEGDTNDSYDVFLYDRETKINSRVSIASDGTESDSVSHIPSISADGRYIAFVSYASTFGEQGENSFGEVYVHDRQTKGTSRVSVPNDGTHGNGTSNYPSISSNGRYVAFHSDASNLVSGDTNNVTDVFVYDQQTQQATRASVGVNDEQANGPSQYAHISPDGSVVAFSSDASNLVPADGNRTVDVFVRDFKKVSSP